MSLGEEQEEFARLIARHQREVQGYIFANSANWTDTDEIWQDTCVRLWQEFDKYEPGSNFAGWAIRIAYYEILTWRNKVSRSRLVFDQSFVDALATEQGRFSSPEWIERSKALDKCVEELSDRKREFLTHFYTPNKSVTDIASIMQCSVDTVYKAVQRIRIALRRCIETHLERD